MPYVVYVNHPTSGATVHNTSCGKYIYRRRGKTKNGYWSDAVGEPPFETLEEALAYANDTGKVHIDTCAFCIK